MQHVSSFGGPRVLLPTSEVPRWIDEIGVAPTPEAGLYGLACSIPMGGAYCGVITPWDTPLLIFGDGPDDIFYAPHEFDGLFFRWCGAESLEQLTAFAIAESGREVWDETVEFRVVDSDMTLMDTCTFEGDDGPRIQLNLRTGAYLVKSRYAESTDVMTVVHRFEYLGSRMD